MKAMVLPRAEQRQRNEQRQMASLGLACHLDSLVHDILGGDASLLSEFQQMVQFAPPEMRERLIARLEAKNESV